MKELIKITESNGNKAVSARELYNFLGTTERFNNWINRQFQYGFEEKTDYVGCKTFNALANQDLDDYILTIDCAKEISMLQKSERGKQARKYFIECEKELSKQFELPDFSNPAIAARAWAEEYEAKIIAEAKVKHLEPKADFYDAVTESKDAIDIGSAAKVLNLGIGRNKLFQKLRELKILMPDNKPYQKYIDSGYFRMIETKFNKPDGSISINLKTVVYQKGLDYIIKRIRK